jgi:hypothetical protein
VRLLRILAAIVLFVLPWSRADVRNCLCDITRPETLEVKECSLCKVAEEQPVDVMFFFVKDINPTKPNRLLALPRFHGKNPQEIADMTPEQRAGYWTATVAKAREVWGNQWGLGMNGLEKRTQCHAHIHMGKLLDNVENDRFIVVDTPAQIPAPNYGNGLWVHPVGDKLHVHMDDPAGELKLVR